MLHRNTLEEGVKMIVFDVLENFRESLCTSLPPEAFLVCVSDGRSFAPQRPAQQ